LLGSVSHPSFVWKGRVISSPVKVLSIVALATLETLAPGKDGFRSLKTIRAAVTVRTLV
jgi:hypothetical protein